MPCQHLIYGSDAGWQKWWLGQKLAALDVAFAAGALFGQRCPGGAETGASPRLQETAETGISATLPQPPLAPEPELLALTSRKELLAAEVGGHYRALQ